jgi:hypothetical protein
MSFLNQPDGAAEDEDDDDDDVVESVESVDSGFASAGAPGRRPIREGRGVVVSISGLSFSRADRSGHRVGVSTAGLTTGGTGFGADGGACHAGTALLEELPLDSGCTVFTAGASCFFCSLAVRAAFTASEARVPNNAPPTAAPATVPAPDGR